MKNLTFNKIIIIILILINAYLGITSYLRSSRNHTPAPAPILSEENKKQLNIYTENIHNFIGIIVVSADIQSNSTQMIYINILDPVVNSAFNYFINDRAISNREPLFVRDGDNINLRIVNLVNHEFMCTSFSDTVSSRFIPDIESYISTVCSISVPPSFGEFNGIINIYLSKKPTIEEIEIIRTNLREMSYQISENLKPKN